LLELVVLIVRGDRAEELEVLVLRHQLSILGGQVRQPRFERHDRLFLAVGYLRIVGELRTLGIAVSATSVRTILGKAGVPSAPQRDRRWWRSFLRAQGESILARDFFTVDTVWLRRVYVLAFLSIGSRRIRVRRLHQQAERRLDAAAGAQPADRTRRPAVGRRGS
jgi:hypothetical protein